MVKIILLVFLFSSFSINAYNNEKETYSWKMQEDYILILKEIKKSLSRANDSLDECRLKVFETPSENYRNMYLKSTNEYSANILTKLAIVSEAISVTESRMINDKTGVMKNLMANYSTLDIIIERERIRKDNLIKSFKDGLVEIKDYFCKDL